MAKPAKQSPLSQPQAEPLQPPPPHPAVLPSPPPAAQPFIAPNGQPVRAVHMPPAPQFPPELQAALRIARDHCGGNYMVAVFTADQAPPPDGKRVTMHMTRGSKWESDENFLKCYRLFVEQHMRISPDLLRMVEHQEPAAAPFPPANLNPVI